MKALYAPALFDGSEFLHHRAVLFDGARVADVVAPRAVPPDAERTDLPDGHLLAPGFVDLQVNGGGGVLFNDAPDAATLQRIAAAHAHAGTTSLLPTLISGSRQQLRAAIAAVQAALKSGVAGIAGLHLEGPFIAPTRRGIHPAQAVTPMNDDDLALLCRPFPAPLLVTLAPEVVPAASIRRLVESGAVVFAGHTEATYEAAMAGFDAGISGVTHLYNAMSGLLPRAPGMVGAALRGAAAFAGIIVDGQHLHAASVRIAFAAKGPDALLLVSDAMPTVGSDISQFRLGGERIRLQGGRLLDDAGTLAGAHLTMADAVRNAACHVGLPLKAVLHMATRTPARAIGLADRGRIAPGCLADFVLLDPELKVAGVWQGGHRRR